MKQTITVFVRLLLLFSIQVLAGQLQITGVVISGQSGEPVPYANIGIINTSVGTLSETDGTFSLVIPQAYGAAELYISSLGFAPQAIPLSRIASTDTLIVRLTEKALSLDPIELTARKPEKKRQITLGNGKSLLLSGQLALDTLYAGSALALKINRQGYEDFKHVHKVSLYIAGNRMPQFKVRLRFLSTDPADGGKPGEPIFDDQIIATSTIRKGWLDFTIPITYTIEAEEFYLAFEWILDREDRQYIADTYNRYIAEYPERIQYDTLVVDGERIATARMGKILAGTMFGTSAAKKDAEHLVSYSRESSFGLWERLSKVLSARIQLGNFPPED